MSWLIQALPTICLGQILVSAAHNPFTRLSNFDVRTAVAVACMHGAVDTRGLKAAWKRVAKSHMSLASAASMTPSLTCLL